MSKQKYGDLPLEILKEIQEQYLGGANVDKLIKKYGLKVEKPYFYKMLPDVIMDENCEYCGANLVHESIPRYKEPDPKLIRCPSCGHKPYVEDCDCDNCKKKKDEIQEKRTRAIKDFLRNQADSVEYSSLTYEERIKLAAAARLMLLRDGRHMMSMRRAEDEISLTPNDYWSSEILQELYKKGVIKMDEDKFASEALYKEDGTGYYEYSSVSYMLNVIDDKDFNLVSRILYPDFNNDIDQYEIKELADRVRAEECAAYFKIEIWDLILDIDAPKAKDVFADMLTRISMLGVLKIIDYRIGCLYRNKYNGVGTDEELIDIFLKECKKDSYNYAYQEEMIISEVDLDEYSPASYIHQVLFDQFLGIGDWSLYRIYNEEHTYFDDCPFI